MKHSTMIHASMKKGSARQNGAALIIGLILLVVLTLLAVSGMNTASTELRMAGNEQFRKRAFEVSEAGIERTLVQGPFVANEFAPPVAIGLAVADPAAPDDQYSMLITSAGQTPPPHLNSLLTFAAEHFTIQSQGTSFRQGSVTVQNASATHLQGFYRVGPAGGTYR
jgi:type IV pilus assembly protein PilX